MNRTNCILSILILLICQSSCKYNYYVCNKQDMIRLEEYLNRKTDRMIKSNDLYKLQSQDIERYYIYNLSSYRHVYVEELKDLSFLKKNPIRKYMDLEGKNGDLRYEGPYTAYFYDYSKDSIVGMAIGNKIDLCHKSLHINDPIYMLREKKLDYVFTCHVCFDYDSFEFGRYRFGIKDNKVFIINSRKTIKKPWPIVTYYYVPIDFFIDNFKNIDEMDLSNFILQ